MDGNIFDWFHSIANHQISESAYLAFCNIICRYNGLKKSLSGWLESVSVRTFGWIDITNCSREEQILFGSKGTLYNYLQ